MSYLPLTRNTRHRLAGTAKTYYVNSATGSDTNNGLSTNASFATIQHAHDITNPGDVVYIMPGNGYGGGTGGGYVLAITRSGSAGQYITYAAYPGTRPVINSTGYWAVVQCNANYIIIQGMEVAGNNGSLTPAGAWTVIYNGTWGTNAQAAYSTAGIVVGDNVTTYHHVQILNNWCHDCPQSGITTLRADYLTVEGNRAWNNSLYSSYAGSGISISNGADSDASTSTKTFVRNNICYTNYMVVGFHAVNYATASTTASATSGSTTLSFSSASTATIAIGTLLFDVTATNAIAVGTYVTAVGSTSITISQPTAAAVGNGDHFAFCTSTDGEGIIVDSNVDTAYGGRTAVYNNLCFDNGNAGVMVTRSSHCDVYFNTCYHNANHYRLGQFGSAGDIYISGSSTDNRIYNNILSVVSGNTMAKDDGTSNTWSTNLCFGGLGTPPGSGNITTDPKFVNPTTNFATMNFKLQNTSPAINAANGTFTRSTDITGAAAPLGGTNDLGAYESA